MSYYCHVCGLTKNRKSFSRKGQRDYICKKCDRVPEDEKVPRAQIEEIHELWGNVKITPRNIARLQGLAQSPHARPAQLARLLWQVALVKPYREDRLPFLAQWWPELYEQLQQTGLADIHSFVNGEKRRREDAWFFWEPWNGEDWENYPWWECD